MVRLITSTSNPEVERGPIALLIRSNARLQYGVELFSFALNQSTGTVSRESPRIIVVIYTEGRETGHGDARRTSIGVRVAGHSSHNRACFLEEVANRQGQWRSGTMTDSQR